MATVESAQGVLSQWPFLVTAVDLTTIQPNQQVAVEHGGPLGAKVQFVTWETQVAPTSKDLLEVRHIRASDDTTSGTDTVQLEVGAAGGADLTGATVRVFFWFIEQAAGGISSSTAQTP